MSSFTIYPAIDIRGGQCVRLVQGDYDRETVYNANPVEVAKSWEAQGGAFIHVVDLDGAKAGHPVNDELIGEIARSVQVPVQVGGGLRSLEDVKRLLALGVSRVILGTAAIEDRAFTEAVLGTYGDKAAIGIDARNGLVATRGWLETSEVHAEVLAKELAGKGAETFILPIFPRRDDAGAKCRSDFVAGQSFRQNGDRFRGRYGAGRFAPSGRTCERGRRRRDRRQSAVYRQHRAGAGDCRDSSFEVE
ncbi:hypothetical protein HMSSN036_20090 [Paenibacillus macerans]|nr:hypothetical protein HMSSN036_20090 [Paenibacillus macerans]